MVFFLFSLFCSIINAFWYDLFYSSRSREEQSLEMGFSLTSWQQFFGPVSSHIKKEFKNIIDNIIIYVLLRCEVD